MSSGHIEIVRAPELAPPRGYAHGVACAGRTLYVGGQVGWDAERRFATGAFADQFAAALDNLLAVVRAAGGEAADVVEMTVYVTDLAAYRASLGELKHIWRPRFGRHYPAMALVGVTGLVEPEAVVEIAAVACLPPGA